MPGRPERARPRRPLAGFLGAALLAAAAACGLPVVGSQGPAAAGAYQGGVQALERGDFERARVALRLAAAECGEPGGSALLLLSSLYLDPRNPEAHPDSAALMAARFLHLESATDEGRRLAEGIYALALRHGADPGLRPRTAGPEASEGGGPGLCPDAAPRPGAERLSLPVVSTLPEPEPEAATEADPGLDSLRAAHREALDRVRALEAELERIRRLLQEPDTAGPGPGG